MMGRPVTNKYRVDRTTWRLWNETQRRVFNRLYRAMAKQNDYMSINCPLIPDKFWQALRRQAAFHAATAVNG